MDYIQSIFNFSPKNTLPGFSSIISCVKTTSNENLSLLSIFKRKILPKDELVSRIIQKKKAERWNGNEITDRKDTGKNPGALFIKACNVSVGSIQNIEQNQLRSS